MKSLSGLTIRYMTKNWKRTITTLIGVFFAALLIFLMFELTDSVTKSIKEQNVRKQEGTDLVFTTDKDTAFQMKEDARSKELGGVKIENLWITAFYKDFIMYDDFKNVAAPVEVSQGKLPEQGGEVIVDPTYAQGVKIGDEITTEDGTLKIVGFYKTYDENWASKLGMMSDKMSINEGAEFTVHITCESKKKLTDQADQIAAAYSGVVGYADEASLALYGQGDQQFQEIGRDAFLLIAALVFAAFLMVIIRNAFNISVDERMRDYGILRCIGLTRAQIFRMIILEAMIVGLIGSVIGILVGYGITAGGLRGASMLQIVEDTFGKGMLLHEVFSLKAILFTVGIVFLTTSLSMVSPIQKLYKMSPIAAQRKEDSISRPKKGQSIVEKGAKNIAVAYGIRSAKRSKGRLVRTVITFSLGLALAISVGNIFRTMLKTEYPAVYTYDYSGSTGSEKKWDELIGKLKSSDSCKGAVGIMNYSEYARTEGSVTMACSLSVSGLTPELWEYVLEQTTLSPAGGDDVVEVLSVLPAFGGKPKYQPGDTFKVKYSDKTFHVAGTVSETYINLLSDSNGYGHVPGADGAYIYKAEPGKIIFGDFDAAPLSASKDKEFVMKEAMTDGVVSAEASGNKKDLQKLMDEYLDNSKSVGGTFAILGLIRTGIIVVLAFLLLISVVNAINVSRGQLNIRKDEIKTLRLIGMSEKQRKMMLLVENMFASVLAAIVGPIIGILAFFGVVKVLYQGNGITGKFDSFEMSINFSIDYGIVIISIIAVLLSGIIVTFFNRND